MNRPSTDTDSVIRFLEGEIDPDTEADLLCRLREDPDCARLQDLDREVRTLLAGAGRAAVPPGFVTRVMDALGEAHAQPAGEMPGKALRRWGPYAAAAALGGLLVAAGLHLELRERDGPLPPSAAAGEGEEPLDQEAVWVRFLFSGDASREVAVAGDFTYWEPIPLSQRWVEGRRVWTGIVAVPRGEHRYMFLVDGTRWVTDPLAPIQRDDSFGNRNAILSL